MNSRATALNGKEKMTVAEAAQYLEVHPESIRRWIRAGKIPAARVGNLGNYTLYKDELEKLMKSKPSIL